MNASFNKAYPIYGKLKIVYDNYNFVSHRACREYYMNQHYKRMIDYLYDTLSSPTHMKIYKEIIPCLESLTPKHFNFLIRLCQDHKIDILINLLKIASKV